jgi:DNA-binding response OmpR family regulator
VGSGGGKTVLVVDDDPSLRLLCRVNLELDGHRVVEAGSVAEAREMLAGENVDAMLLDIHLGDGDGRDLVESLGGARPPVAFFTGSAQIDDQLRALVDDVLAKPFTLDALAETVRRLLSVRRLGTLPTVTAAGVLAPVDYEERLRQYLFERSEEGRAVRVGEKEISEQAEIVARFADLFSREQLDALWDAEREAEGEEREQLYRLRKVCEGGIVSAELVEREDELENRQLAARLSFQDEELPLRAAQAKLAVINDYREREALGELHADLNATFNDERLDLARTGEELAAELSQEPDPVARNEEEKGISLRSLAAALAETSAAAEQAYLRMRGRWFDRVLGSDRDDQPSSYHSAYVRRMSPLEATYTKERATDVCLETLKAIGFDLAADPNIKPDLDDRPQKSPRACVIASDPPQVVHLITRAQGGLHDYQAFLHEAGHALHYAGCDPALPYTFRRLSRDHALTEIYSYILEAISREPGWHALHFGLSDAEATKNAEATTFLEALLFRRYTAKLEFELEFWGRFTDDGGTSAGYAERLTAATGVRYRPDGFISDMDPGFYSADYLRAWIRSAQLRSRLTAEIGEDWWRSPETGERLRALFREGTKPSSEEIAGRLGFDPLDTSPLLHELGADAAGGARA